MYVNDVLCIYKSPENVLNLINMDYRLKEPPICPAMYLGADICKYFVGDEKTGANCWAMSADSHIKKALDIVKLKMKENGVIFIP